MDISQAAAVTETLQKLAGAGAGAAQAFASMATVSNNLKAINELSIVILQHRPDLDIAQLIDESSKLSATATTSVKSILEEWASLARCGKSLPFEAETPHGNKGA